MLSGVLQSRVHLQFYNVIKRTLGSRSQGEILGCGRSAAAKKFIRPSKVSLLSEGRLAFTCLVMHCSNFIYKGGRERVSRKFPHSTLPGTSFGGFFCNLKLQRPGFFLSMRMNQAQGYSRQNILPRAEDQIQRRGGSAQHIQAPSAAP